MSYVKETAPRLKKMTSLKVVQEDEMREFVRMVGELRKGLSLGKGERRCPRRALADSESGKQQVE